VDTVVELAVKEIHPQDSEYEPEDKADEENVEY